MNRHDHDRRLLAIVMIVAMLMLGAKTLVNLATDVTGIAALVNGGTASSTASGARTNLAVPAAGSCTNQVVTATNVNGAPTCSSLSQPMAASGFFRAVIIGGGAGNTLGTSGTQFFMFPGETTISSTESFVQVKIGVAFTLKNMCCSLVAVPGAGTSRTLTLRDGAATPASGPVVTISGTAQQNCDFTHSATVAANDLLDMQSTVSGTPAAGGVTCNAEVDM